ncbi:Olfactory receptor 51F1 [Heterocephalus glaber]|uniref:Olfactory receptor 51F1 n=1 Tax=Heterocephalus glaber TaxID=10181 RepID=G5B996_HETGA|nr:Olfactory receptor 51F1 [Heterocephalus glaber]
MLQIQSNMKILSNLSAKSPNFLLTGIPSLESAQAWISIPFCCLYAIALSGNSAILFVIITQQSLHKPMYYFLSMLSAIDLGLTVSTMSTTLGILWFDAREISLDACIIQMFFLHAFTIMESGVLVAMAFDRYVAICNPLRMNALSHSYCYYPDVIKLACSDIWANNICGLVSLILTTGIDTPCIILSYVLIIHSVHNIASPQERNTLFSTCISHIGAVAVFYNPVISLSLVHHYRRSAPKVVHSVMANVYLLLPPVLNPIIYSVKAKQIRKAVLSLYLTK